MKLTHREHQRVYVLMLSLVIVESVHTVFRLSPQNDERQRHVTDVKSADSILRLVIHRRHNFFTDVYFSEYLQRFMSLEVWIGHRRQLSEWAMVTHTCNRATWPDQRS